MTARSLLLGVLIAGTLLPASLHAQGATDLFLVELRAMDGRLGAGRVTRLTNRNGYDNQPHFTPDGAAVLYTSIDAAGQADIHRIDLNTLVSAPVTRTAPESEYSATPMPGGTRISVIRVEADSTQRLWSFTLDGTDPRVVLKDVKPVGYHAWLDAAQLVLFVLGSPPTLQLADARTGRATVIAENIGRSLHRIPGREAFSFVQRTADGATITAFVPAGGALEPLIAALPENEYHAWLPDGTLLTARGSTLLMWQPSRGSDWEVVADLAAGGVREISRLATSPDGRRLVVVGAH